MKFGTLHDLEPEPGPRAPPNKTIHWFDCYYYYFYNGSIGCNCYQLTISIIWFFIARENLESTLRKFFPLQSGE